MESYFLFEETFFIWMNGIVGRIEAERQIIEGNRELVRLYEAKIKKVIEKVWAS